MINSNQRWLFRRDRYRPAAEVIRTAEYEVAEIPDDRTAKKFVTDHHYSGSYPAARFRYGLYRRSELVGVSVFSHPCNDRVLTSVFPCSAIEAVELGRFVLLDSVPGNGETWFLGRCFEELRKEGLQGVVSFSDPVARRSADGVVVFPGHIGTIYQAHNAVYLGRGTPRRLRLLSDGSVLSDRAIQKLRSKTKGWEYTARLLVAAGADEPGADLRLWWSHWAPVVTRTIAHPGNHKYAWAIAKPMQRLMPTSMPYPKGK